MKVVTKCMNAAYGCSREAELDVIASHEKTCPWRVVYCPAMHRRSCRWSGSISRLMVHNRETNCLQILHNNIRDGSTFKSFIGDIREADKSVFDRKFVTHWKPILLISPTMAEYLLYLTVQRSSRGLWYLMVRSCHPEFLLARLKVKLEVFKSEEEEDQKHTYEGGVISNKLSEEGIVATGHFLMLRDTQVKRLITKDNIFQYKVTMTKRAPKRRAEEGHLQDERPREDSPGR